MKKGGEKRRGQVSTLDKQWGRDGYGMSFVEKLRPVSLFMFAEKANSYQLLYAGGY